jgi:hypothetical protein
MHGRIARLLAALGMAGTLVVGGAPAPAQAAQVTLGVFTTDTTIGADSDGMVKSSYVSASELVELQQPRMTFDASDLAGQVVLTEWPYEFDCTSPAPAVLDCRFRSSLHVGPEPGQVLFMVLVKPTAAATAGASGALKVTFEGNGSAPVAHESRLRIGEGVDLAADVEDVTVAAKPGAAFSAPAPVRNDGATVAEGAVAVFAQPYAIRPRASHRNCDYHEGRLIACHFDTALQPGARYVTSVAYTLGKDTLAPGTQDAAYGWMTPAEYEDLVTYQRYHGVPVGSPGTGAPLPLKRVTAAARAGKPQVDTVSNNHGRIAVTVTGRNGADLAGIGATVTGRAGAVVPAVVGLVNRGPATVEQTVDSQPVTTVKVSAPIGTTVVGVPPGCFREPYSEWDPRSNEPGARTYYCDSSTFLLAGRRETFEFSLRIDRVVPNATGTAQVNPACACPVFPGDTKPSNDTAKIRVNPKM